MSAPGKTTVVYILSSPHSGSTLLGTILGSQPSIQYGGELYEIPDPAWGSDTICTCGQPTSSCPLWSKVEESLSTTTRPSDVAESVHRFSGASGILRLRLAGWFPNRATKRYAAEVSLLAQALARASGRPMVVDSSHGPGRALAYQLARSPSFDVRFVHLLRDGRRVVASRKRSTARRAGAGPPGPHAALRFAFLWVGANLLFSAWFGWGRSRYLRIRYEDLITDPAATMERLGGFLGTDLSGCAQSILEGRPFPVRHLLSGNRFRLAGEVKVARSIAEDKDGLLPRERRAFTLVAGLSARLYGYR